MSFPCAKGGGGGGGGGESQPGLTAGHARTERVQEQTKALLNGRLLESRALFVPKQSVLDFDSHRFARTRVDSQRDETLVHD